MPLTILGIGTAVPRLPDQPGGIRGHGRAHLRLHA